MAEIRCRETPAAREAYEYWRDEMMKNKAIASENEDFLESVWRRYVKIKGLRTPLNIWRNWKSTHAWDERFERHVKQAEEMVYRGNALDTIERLRTRLEQVSVAGVEIASKSFVELMQEIRERGPGMFRNMSDKDLIKYFEMYTKIIPNLVAITESLAGFEAIEEIVGNFKARSDAERN